MIKNYNNYINKEDEIVTEKLEINLKKLIDKVKEKIQLAKSSVIYSSVTYDDKLIKVNDNYYALFFTTDESEKKQYAIGKVKITGNKKKTIKKGGKEHIIYTYKLLSVSPKLHSPEKVDDEGNTVKGEEPVYKLYKTELGETKLLGTSQVNGFYLYADEKTDKDLDGILKRFDLLKEPQAQEPIDTSKLEIGNIYKTEKDGQKVKLGILAKQEDGQFLVKDMETKKVFPMKKIKNPKLSGDLGEKYDDIFDGFKLTTIKESDDYIKASPDDKIKFIQNKAKKLKEFKEHISKNILNYKSDGGEFYDSITKMRNSINGILSNYNSHINSLNKVEEPKEEKDESKEDIEMKDKIKTSEAQGAEVKTKIQNEESEVKKPRKQNPAKKQAPAGSTTVTQKVPEEAPMESVEQIRFRKFNNIK